MKKFSEIREARGDTCVFTFGRFNPPTTGHEKLLEAVASQAKKNPGAPYYVFASHSENAKKDPLPYTKKVAYMKKMFPKHARNIIVDKARNVFEIAVSLHNKGHKAIVMVVGSDRVAEFDSLLNKYNGVEARHGYYGFDNIEVVSAGERDPDAEGVTGMSASKMRAAASANDFEQFKLGLPRGFGDGKKLFADVRKHMGIRESFVSKTDVLTEEDVFRDMYVRGEILNIGDEVTDSYSGVTGKVIRRGTNYVTFAEEDGTVHKKWLYELLEMTTGQLIQKVLAKTTKKKGYEKAVEVMKSVIDRKMKETGGKLKHTIEYYAGQIARTMNGIDGRELADVYKTKYEDCWDGFKQVGMKKKDGKDVPNCVPEGKQDKDIKDKKGTQPAKYFAKDAEGDEMAKSTKDKRDAHFNKGKEKDDDDPSAYKPAPGDASAKTKPSSYTNKMKKKFPDLYKETVLENADKSLAKKAEASGISVSILKQVYNRGVAAWRTGHRPGTTPEQWGHARVNSFITGGKTRTTADADLWKQHKGKSESFELEEARAKQAVAGGKVQKLITGFDMSYKGKKYNEIDFELVNIDNNTQVVTLKIIGPKEIFGGEVKIPFKTLRRGRFMATDTSKESVEDPREVGTDARREMTQKMTPGQEVKKFSFKEHLDCGTPNCCNECETSSLIESNIYRVGSEKYYEFFQEKRDAYKLGVYNPVGFDKELMEGDLGKMDYYQGQPVPLDCPMMFEEKDVELNKPKVGGPKKYYVYVKDPKTGNVKKVTFGDTSGLKVKLDDKKARKSFAARHNCDQQKDKTKAGYWSCNLPRYAKQLGLSGGGNFYW